MIAVLVVVAVMLRGTSREAVGAANAAIGIRFFPNPDDLSAQQWYADQCANRVIPQCGSSTPVLVNGYVGIRDGGSVYLHVAHRAQDRLRTVIVLFSLSRDAGEESEATLQQLLANVRLSDNVSDTRQAAALRRDTLRRAHLASIRRALTAYQYPSGERRCSGALALSCTGNTQNECPTGEHCQIPGRCSITQTQGCLNDSQCPTGERCGNFVPPLRSGTFVQGASFSVWPSWQSTLGAALGGTLPEDPGRPSTSTPGAVDHFVGCGGQFDQRSCWDAARSSMQCPTQAFVYGYRAVTDAGAAAPNRAILSTNYEYDDAQTGAFDWIPDNQRMNDVLSGLCATSAASATLDRDADSVVDRNDNCPNDPNTDQGDRDRDGSGDACDAFPFDDQNDSDGDGIGADRDLCPTIRNTGRDGDNDGIDDACDTVNG